MGGGNREPKFLWIKSKYPHPKLRYALGRTNHDPNGGYGTSKFHANPYFSCVTAIQMPNRRQLIAEIWIEPVQSNSN